MSDVAEPRVMPSSVDAPRVLFWGALGLAFTGAGVALAAGPGVGRIGAFLLVALAALGVVLLVWLSRGSGRLVGLFPARGAAQAAVWDATRLDGPLLESLEEPALLTARNGAPIFANQAYVALAERAGLLGDETRAPAPDRLFGGDPLLGPAMFRLARAAAARQSRRELLAPAYFGGRSKGERFEAIVSPASDDRVLWRLRPATPEGDDGGEHRTLFVEDCAQGFLAARVDGTITYMNAALRAAWGRDATPKLKDLFGEDVLRLLRRERRPGDLARHPVTLLGLNGNVSAALVPLAAAGEDGLRALVLIGVGADAAKADAQTQPGHGSFFESAPFGAALLSGSDPATASILDSNSALVEMAEGAAIPGAGFADLFEASEGPAALAQRLRQASRQPVEVSLATSPPKAVHFYMARAEDGRGLAYLINMTEQRELEQRLSQAEKMREIGMLAGGVAHDFNNLLTAMMQNCDFLLRRHPLGDPDYQDLCEINHHALRAKELSERLRAYARQQTFKRELVDVSGFLAQFHELLRRLLGETIEFQMWHGRDLPFIKADRSQLERVLVNLATNARDAMLGLGKGAKLTVRTSRTTAAEARAFGYTPILDGEYVLIEVVDTGHGIKPEDQAKIFRPFYSTKEAGKGTGLGLATSYGIIKQSEGYIFFSSAVGVGTTFRIYLPAYEPTAEELEEMAQREREAAQRPPLDVSGRGRILLVEDEDGVRKSIARNLVECGYEVDEAEDGEEGLKRLTDKPGGYDLVISDVTMPFMSGPEMLEAASEAMIGKAKVLFLSGYAPESFAKMLERYPVSYMSKPVGLTPLAQRVKELLTK